MSIIERSDTLVGPTIYYKKSDDSCFSLTINQSGILLADGVSEIPIEVGEQGPEGNSPYVDYVDDLTGKELALLYEVAIYQYKEFKRAQKEE